MASILDNKKKIIDEYAQSEGDTGSPEIQVALLTKRITKLAKHLEEHRKDNHSRRGLLSMVGKRRRLLKFLQKKSLPRYKKLVSKLEIKVT